MVGEREEKCFENIVDGGKNCKGSYVRLIRKSG